MLSKNSFHCRLAGWTGGFGEKLPVLPLLHHLEVSCQAKQGAVVDVLWNQQSDFAGSKEPMVCSTKAGSRKRGPRQVAFWLAGVRKPWGTLTSPIREKASGRGVSGWTWWTLWT
jgi:hypothetical protein